MESDGLSESTGDLQGSIMGAFVASAEPAPVLTIDPPKTDPDPIGSSGSGPAQSEAGPVVADKGGVGRRVLEWALVLLGAFVLAVLIRQFMVQAFWIESESMESTLEVRGRVYFDNGGNGGMRITGTSSNPTNALFESTQYEEGLVGGSTRPFWRMYSAEFYASSPLEYRSYSDRSLKSSVEPIGNAVATLQALEGVTYVLDKHPMDTRDRQLSDKEEYKRRHQLGFIAQDIAKVLPQLVDTDEFSGLESVGYMGVIPILVEAIKEQQVQIDELKAELAAQKR